MPNGTITWHGVASNTVGVKAVEKYPDLDRPRRKFSKQSIPGATGDVIVMEDAWEDYTQEYEIYAGTGANGNAPVALADVASWLYAGSGYQRLEDTYDTSCYREAYFSGPFDVENHFNRYGSCKISFTCKGKRWLKTGESTSTISTSGGTITNPTDFAAAPVITLHGTTGTATLTVAGTLVTLPEMEEGLVLDCEKMTVTDSGGDPSNGSMALGPFPKLTAGTNTITWTGTITSVEIVPRWFVI